MYTFTTKDAPPKEQPRCPYPGWRASTMSYSRARAYTVDGHTESGASVSGFEWAAAAAAAV